MALWERVSSLAERRSRAGDRPGPRGLWHGLRGRLALLVLLDLPGRQIDRSRRAL